jgi:hypothetical protein
MKLTVAKGKLEKLLQSYPAVPAGDAGGAAARRIGTGAALCLRMRNGKAGAPTPCLAQKAQGQGLRC